MQNNAVRRFSPDGVIAALLAYPPENFSNAPENIHETVYKLQKNGYNDLPGDFAFISIHAYVTHHKR